MRMGRAFWCSACCGLPRRLWLRLPTKVFGRQPGLFTATVWVRTSSQSVWNSLPGWIRGPSLTNRKAGESYGRFPRIRTVTHLPFFPNRPRYSHSSGWHRIRGTSTDDSFWTWSGFRLDTWGFCPTNKKLGAGFLPPTPSCPGCRGNSPPTCYSGWGSPALGSERARPAIHSEVLGSSPDDVDSKVREGHLSYQNPRGTPITPWLAPVR